MNSSSIESATGDIEDGFPDVEEVEPPRSVLDHIPMLEVDCFAQQSFAEAPGKDLHATRVPPQEADSSGGFGLFFKRGRIFFFSVLIFRFPLQNATWLSLFALPGPIANVLRCGNARTRTA
jgi:hypothetical protein